MNIFQQVILFIMLFITTIGSAQQALEEINFNNRKVDKLVESYDYGAAYDYVKHLYQNEEKTVGLQEDVLYLAIWKRDWPLALEVGRVLEEIPRSNRIEEFDKIYVDLLLKNGHVADAVAYAEQALSELSRRDSMSYYEALLSSAYAANGIDNPTYSLTSIDLNTTAPVSYLSIYDGNLVAAIGDKVLNYEGSNQKYVLKNEVALPLKESEVARRVSFASPKSAWYCVQTFDNEKCISSKIFKSDKAMNGQWVWPIEQEVIASFDFPVYDPFVSTVNGVETIFFTAELPGGFGGQDIYMVALDKGNYSTPKNLGSFVNTAYDEISPAFYEDVLYFSTNRVGVLGGLDLYKSSFTANVFGQGVNMGKGVNSAFDDYCWRQNKSGEVVFISDRTLTSSIYNVTIEPTPGVYLSASIDSVLQDDVIFSVLDSKAEKVSVYNRNADFYWLNAGREYDVVAQKRGYWADTFQLNIPNSAGATMYALDIPMEVLIAQANKPLTGELWIEGRDTVNFAPQSGELTEYEMMDLSLVATYVAEDSLRYVEVVQPSSMDSLTTSRVNRVVAHLIYTEGLAAEKLYEVIDDNEIAPADGVVVRIVKQVVGDENAVPVMGEEESTIVDFTTMEIDFGTVKAGTLSKYIFEFTNNGEFPYVIEYIGASCGCTLPTYSNKPVAPGGLGFVEVGFDATDKSGLQETTVTIIGNTLEKVIELKIKAFVE